MDLLKSNNLSIPVIIILVYCNIMIISEFDLYFVYISFPQK